MARDEEPAFWTDAQAMLAHRTSASALGIAMSLVVEVYLPNRQPFAWDATALAKAITAPGTRARDLERRKAQVATYFIQLPDGRWEPSPMFFRFREPDEDTEH